MKYLSDIEKSSKELEVSKHLDLEYDLGTLLAMDSNSLDLKYLKENKNEYLVKLSRDNVQLLLNSIWKLPSEKFEDSLVVKLPQPKFILPRSRPIPKSKLLTRWQQFAKLKGIQKRKRAKLSWDEQLNKWVPLHGYKRAVAQKERDWVLEVPSTADPMQDQFSKIKSGKLERVAKNELQRLRNIAKAKNIKVPQLGVTNSDISSPKDLQTAIDITHTATTNIGKFQSKLPREKNARDVMGLTVGSNRKRKFVTVSNEAGSDNNLKIMDSVLNKRSKLDLEKVIVRHFISKPVGKFEEKQKVQKGRGRRQ